MSDQHNPQQSTSRKIPVSPFANSHYAILGLHPSASVREIRQAYRELSKRYHPDTTVLPDSVATAKFQRLNEAYGVLSNPERRSLYDLKIGYSRWHVIQPPQERQSIVTHPYESKSAYLDATERPLSGGEMFALLILGLTLAGCLVLAIFIGILRGDAAIPPTALPQDYHDAVIDRIFLSSASDNSSPFLTSL